MKHNQIAIAALMFVSAFCLTACGGESSAAPQSSASSDASISETVASSTESSDEESTVKTDEPASAEDNTAIEWGCLKLQIPGSFYTATGEPGAYLGETEHSPKAVVIYCEDEYYKSGHEGEEYTAVDVPDILKSDIIRKLRSYYNAYESTCEITVDSQEETEVLGAPFMLVKGVTRCSAGSDEETDLQYVGCYGVVDSQRSDNKDVPLAWIAYTEETSGEALTEIEEIIRNATKSAQFTS